MPHSNGKIYAQGDYGVSTDDVASVLGVTSHDVGTLCTCSAINMWSKYKPVKNDDVNPYSSSSWWKGESKAYPCGIKAKVFDRNDISSVESYFTTNNMNGWEYQRLSTGDCFRLADFNGYNHKANPPFGGISVINESNWGTKLYAIMAVNIHAADVDGESGSEVTFQMILGKNYVHPVFVVGNSLIRYNVQDSLTNKYDKARFDVEEGKEYTIYPLFYVSDSETPDETLEFNKRTLYTCVGVSPFTAIARANLQFNYTVKQTAEKTLKILLTVTNVSSYSIPMEKCYIWLRTSVDYISDLIVNVEQELLPLQTITVASEETVILYNSYVIMKNTMTINNAHLLVSLDNGNKRMDVPILKLNDSKE